MGEAKAPLGSRVLKQVAFVVADIEAAVATYSELLGMDPPEIRTPPPREGRQYLGKPLPEAINLKVAMFELDNITLELIEPLGGAERLAGRARRAGRHGLPPPRLRGRRRRRGG